MEDCNKKALVGKYFVSFDSDGRLCWRGQIMSCEGDGFYLVEKYDWCDGQTYDMELINFKDMTSWKFYQTEEELGYHSLRYTKEYLKS